MRFFRGRNPMTSSPDVGAFTIRKVALPGMIIRSMHVRPDGIKVFDKHLM